MFISKISELRNCYMFQRWLETYKPTGYDGSQRGAAASENMPTAAGLRGPATYATRIPRRATTVSIPLAVASWPDVAYQDEEDWKILCISLTIRLILTCIGAIRLSRGAFGGSVVWRTAFVVVGVLLLLQRAEALVVDPDLKAGWPMCVPTCYVSVFAL